jgi:L-lactate permease
MGQVKTPCTSTVWTISLGLINVTVKAVHKGSEGFAYLKHTFSKISKDNRKEGILIGTQITQQFENQGFSTE